MVIHKDEVATTTPAPTPDATAALMQLLGMMMEKERVGLENVKKDAAAQAAHNKAAKIENDAWVQKKVASQVKCNHEKGGANKDASQKLDYAISLHQFIDKSLVAKCLNCGCRWKNTDTAEFFIREGVKIKNWSGTGWTDSVPGKPSVAYMLKHTTNKVTRSEGISDVQQGVADATTNAAEIENIEKISF